VRRWLLVVAAVFALALATPSMGAVAEEPPTLREIAGELMCQCGCGLTVAACQESMPCTTSDAMVAEIQRLIDEGKSKQEIFDYFVASYGEGVLALPQKSGFSLAAWVAPFLALSAGAVFISGLAWFWTRRGGVRREAAAPEPPSDDLKTYEERVDRDVGRLDWGDGR